MRLTPALTWAHLFPAATRFAPLDSAAKLPDEFASLLATSRERASGPLALVGSGASAGSLPNLDGVAGLVLVNERGLSRARLRAAGFAYVRRFAALPSLANPRWFVPLESGAVASGAFCLYTPVRASARLKELGARVAARSGMPFWYRDRLTIAQRELPPIEAVLSAILSGTSPRLALSAGPTTGPDAQRKAAIGVLDLRGRPLAFGKLAGSATAAGILRHEAEALPALTRLLGSDWGGPRLLFEGEIDGTYLTFQSPVRGRRVGPELTAAHQHFLSRLRYGEPVRATETHLVGALSERLAFVPELRSALERVSPTLEDLVLPRTVVHGDFLPWNLRAQRDRLVAFDWENSELDGLPLLDELDHLLSVGDLVQDWTVEQAAARLKEFVAAGPLALSQDQTRAVVAVALLNLLARLIELGHELEHPRVAWNRALLDGIVAELPEPALAGRR